MFCQTARAGFPDLAGTQTQGYRDVDTKTFPVLGPDALNADQASLWNYIVEGPRGKRMGPAPKPLPGPFNPWLLVPAFGRCAAEMGEILRLKSILPGDLREIAILTAGVRWKAEFEFWAHARFALAEGVGEPILQALREGTDPPFANDRQRLAHEAAVDLLETGRLTNDVRSRLAEALGWPATVELVALVGFYCMVSFTLNVFDVGLPDGEAPLWAK
jgi:4-carboxymuconolactone decarboxylase